ncbi:MAG: nitrilase-related carbon-nitrogen hydrolase [Candidatus Saccharimonadales bacterium]
MKHKQIISKINTNYSLTIKVRIVFYVCSVLLGFSFIISGFEWLTFLSLLGWLYYVDNLSELTNKQILQDFYIGTFLVMGLAYCWLMQAEAQNWNVSLHGWFKVVAQIVSWLLVCSFVSLSGLILGWIMSKFVKNRYRILIFVLCLPVIEVIRSYLFAIISYGTGGSLAPNFFVGSIAVSASGTFLVFASRLIGFVGLSLFGLLLSLGVYLIIRRRFRFVVPTMILISIVTIFGYKLSKNNLSHESLKVVTVHLNEAVSMKDWQDFSSLPDDVDLLVLPEYSGVTSNENISKLWEKLSPDGVVITTVAIGRPPNAVNRLTIFDNEGRVINQQDKDFLIPAGEYLPYSLMGAFKLLRQNKNIENFRYTQQLQPGSYPINVVQGGRFKIGALACSGVVSSSEYGRLSREGADILTNSASLSFLKQNSRFDVFGKNMARYQAVANQKYFVQSSRSGESFIISPNGRFIETNSSQNSQIIFTDLEI